MIHKIECKTALSDSKLPGLTYSLNPYRGCFHGCVYCYVPNVFRVARSDWNTNIYVKKNIDQVLMRELRRKNRGIVGISTSTDAYQPAEKKFGITRNCIKLLRMFNWPVDILTKSDLILRDIEILSEMKDLKIGFTIPTLNDAFRRLLEPNAPSIEKRLFALEKVSESQIYTYVFLGPCYPDINKKTIEAYVDRMVSIGVKEIIIDTFHLKKGIWDNIASTLPQLSQSKFKEFIREFEAAEIATSVYNYGKGRIKVSTAFK